MLSCSQATSPRLKSISHFDDDKLSASCLIAFSSDGELAASAALACIVVSNAGACCLAALSSSRSFWVHSCSHVTSPLLKAASFSDAASFSQSVCTSACAAISRASRAASAASRAAFSSSPPSSAVGPTGAFAVLSSCPLSQRATFSASSARTLKSPASFVFVSSSPSRYAARSCARHASCSKRCVRSSSYRKRSRSAATSTLAWHSSPSMAAIDPDPPSVALSTARLFSANVGILGGAQDRLAAAGAGTSGLGGDASSSESSSSTSPCRPLGDEAAVRSCPEPASASPVRGVNCVGCLWFQVLSASDCCAAATKTESPVSVSACRFRRACCSSLLGVMIGSYLGDTGFQTTIAPLRGGSRPRVKGGGA
mmetsp:Transcript_85942/g.221255  ORF Transcript_85942/g.221255 Transcript_85942/m.221255 type:complete len:369 (+) Transcript_85942:675-1781(+)